MDESGTEVIGDYRGVRIRLRTTQQPDGNWTADFALVRDEGEKTVGTPYAGQRAYPTRDMAKQEAMEMAQREIDQL